MVFLSEKKHLWMDTMNTRKSIDNEDEDETQKCDKWSEDCSVCAKVTGKKPKDSFFRYPENQISTGFNWKKGHN